ncbi:MAG: hypothetical protein ACXABY_02940 [Candidatus Thorarchaeota archaeon]
MALFPKLSVLKKGQQNFGQIKTGKSSKASSKTGNVSPFKRGGTGKVSGKGVGGSKGQLGGGRTERATGGSNIKGGKNGGF